MLLKGNVLNANKDVFGSCKGDYFGSLKENRSLKNE